MVDLRLLIASSASVMAAVIWGYVGWMLWRREVPSEHAAAARAFALSWFGMGAVSGIAGVVSLAAVWRELPAGLMLLLAWTTVPLALMAMGGLLAYILHLFTGHRSAVRFAFGAYGVYLGGVVAILLWLDPIGASATGWSVRFVFANAQPAANPALASALLVPTLAGSLAYLSVYRRASTPTARWRIGLVGGGLATWTLAALAARAPGLGADAVGIARAVGALTAIVVLLAYRPPVAATRRWKVRAISDEMLLPRRHTAARDARLAALDGRVRDLV